MKCTSNYNDTNYNSTNIETFTIFLDDKMTGSPVQIPNPTIKFNKISISSSINYQYPYQLLVQSSNSSGSTTVAFKAFELWQLDRSVRIIVCHCFLYILLNSVQPPRSKICPHYLDFIIVWLENSALFSTLLKKATEFKYDRCKERKKVHNCSFHSFSLCILSLNIYRFVAQWEEEKTYFQHRRAATTTGKTKSTV